MRPMEFSGDEASRHQMEKSHFANADMGHEAGAQNGLGIEALKLLDKNAARKIDTSDGWVPASVINSEGKKVYASWAAEILDGHQYTVKAGDSLYQVARRSLGVTGHPDASAAEIKREMHRITELNKKEFPSLKHGRVEAGSTLQLAKPESILATRQDNTPATAAEINKQVIADIPSHASGDAGQQDACKPKDRVAVRNAVVHAEKCDNFEIFENGVAVVRPGADVIVNAGGHAFVFGGRVSAKAGSAVIAVGGDVDAQPGSRVRYVADTRQAMR